MTSDSPRSVTCSARAFCFAAILCVWGATLYFSACSSKSNGRELDTRAVVIGIDSADWKVIDALAKTGGMPNLMRLRERGVWGPIETLNDVPLSPVIWTSVATGKTAAKHGVAWFMVDQPDGTRAPVRSYNRKSQAIWNIAAKSGLLPTTVGWWATYPAEDVGRGTIVSDALGFHGFGTTARGGDDGHKTHPSSLFAEVEVLVPPEQQITPEFAQRFIHIDAKDYRDEMFDPARFPKRDPLNPIHLFQQYAVTAQGYTAIAEDLLEKKPFDLFMVYFEQVDSFSHLFMKYAPPKLAWIDEPGFARYRDVVSEWYRYQDELLGRLLAKIDLDKTAVFILSDHGFKSGERRIKSEELVDVKKAHLDHETHGIFVAAGPHIRRGGEVTGASVLDITPTLLHYLGLPVAKDMDGKVLDGTFEPEFMKRRPIRYVATYEDGQRDSASVQAAPSDPHAQKEAEEQLRKLGYVGDDPDERPSGKPKVAAAEKSAAASSDKSGEQSRDDAKASGEQSSAEIHNNLGRIHLRNGDADKALVEFEKALKADPKNADALLNISSIHQGEGKTDLALHFVQRALAVDPSSTGALAQLAELRRDEGKLDEAIRLFNEALAIDNSQPSLYMGIGDVLQRAGHFDEAIAAFKHVLELEPDSFKARYNLGVTYSNMGRVDEAVAIYGKALELAPKDVEAPAAHNNLGALYLAQGKTDAALAQFEEALKSSPNNIESRYNAAIIYLDTGRTDDAIKLLEQAAKLQPNHEQVNLRLGMAYLESDRGQDAYNSLLLVRRLYPKNWVATIGLAVLHARAKELDTAKRLLAEALQQGGDDARAAAAGFPILKDLAGK